MLFDARPDTIESEKERNLYYKFFAGYFLNELVEGAESRIRALVRLLHERTNVAFEMNPTETHVTFDLHGYLLDHQTDRGELADVALHCPKTNTLVVIEVKFLSTFTVQKDIVPLLARIEAVQNKHRSLRVVPFLLIPQTQWTRAARYRHQKGSNWARFERDYADKVGLLFWENFLGMDVEPRVRAFLQNELSLEGRARADRYYASVDGIPIRTGWGSASTQS